MGSQAAMIKSQHTPLFVGTAVHGMFIYNPPGRLAYTRSQSPITDCRSQYHFGKTLGAGTYGIVREADINGQKVAIKIILKRNVKGNEQMVYDELKMLQSLNHPHIVKFHDWFESRVSCSTAWVRSLHCSHVAGQVLYRYPISHWRRALRPNLRPGQIYRARCFPDHQTSPRSC